MLTRNHHIKISAAINTYTHIHSKLQHSLI